MSIDVAQPNYVRPARAPAGSNSYQAILRNPNYQELVRSRNRLALVLSLAMLVIYLTFIMLVAFAKPLLAIKVGTTTSVGIVLGLVIIVVSFVLTAAYVVRANGRFDELADAVRREAGQ